MAGEEIEAEGKSREEWSRQTVEEKVSWIQHDVESQPEIENQSEKHRALEDQTERNIQKGTRTQVGDDNQRTEA